MNSPSRLLNSSMSISVAAGGEASSSSFCLQSASFSPIHCHHYSSLAELSLSSSSLDVTIPFTSSQLTATISGGLISSGHAAHAAHNQAVSQPSSNNNSLLASPVTSRSPRLLESPNISLLSHDLFYSPTLRQPISNDQNHSNTLFLQTPTHSLSEAPIILSHKSNQRSSPPRGASMSPVASGLLSLSNLSSSISQVQQSQNQRQSGKASASQNVAVQIRPAPRVHRVSSVTSVSSVSSSAQKRPYPTSNKPRPPPPKIAPAPTPGHRFNNSNRRENTSSVSKLAAATRPPHTAPQMIVAAPATSSQPVITMENQPVTSLLIGAQPQTTAVQGLLIQVPGQSQPLLAIPPIQTVAPQPLLIMAPQTPVNQTIATEQHNPPVNQSNNFASTPLTIQTTELHERETAHPNASDRALGISLRPETAHLQTTEQFKVQKIRADPLSAASKLNPTVTTSRNLDDEDIPTKSINLENLNCARSLVSFPPTLPAFTTSAKQNFDHFMSMSRLSLLASPTGGTSTPSLMGGSGPSSPNSHLLSLSPTLTNDNPVAIPDLPGSLPGFTPAQLAQGLRLADAVHLAPDTTISGIVVGKLLEAVRRCRERRTHFGMAQQEVANKLVPVHGEMFRQASICKLENLSIKLELANRMVAVLEKFYDEKEEELKNLPCGAEITKHQGHKPHPRTKFYSRHSQRHSFTDEARECLRSVFANNPYPSRNMISEIATKFAIPRGVVRVWFANRRLEQKKRLKAVASSASASSGLDIMAPGLPILSKGALRARTDTITSSSSVVSADDEVAMDCGNDMDDDLFCEASPATADSSHIRSNKDKTSDLFFLRQTPATSFFGA